MSRYALAPQAISDIEGIHDFIASDNVAAAAHFVTGLRAICRTLAETPSMGRARPELRDSIRSFPAGRYVVFYRREDRTLEVVRVLHGARDIDALWGDG